MRITTLFIMLTILTLTITMFWHTATVDPTSGNFNYYNSTDTNETTRNYMWDYVTNPTTIFSNPFWIFMAAFFAALGLTAVFSGVFRFTSSDAVTFSPWVYLMFSYTSACMVIVWTFLQTELSSYMCSADTFCMGSKFIALIIVAPFAIYSIFSIYQAWRTGFTSS